MNRRPVRRVGYFLWIAGLSLAVLNGFLYWDYLSGQGVTETGLQGVMEQLDEESRLLELARARLAGLETEELNRKVEFVNLRIQQRTFSWSRLFDVFAATLPNDVRLSTLTPRFEDARGRSSSRSISRSRTTGPPSDAVQLEIRGQAKSSEALLEFLDQLFAHAAFDDPDLHQEQTRRDQEIIEFSISTNYRPDVVGSAGSEGSGTQEDTE